MRIITILICMISLATKAQIKAGFSGGAALTHLKFEGDTEQGGILPSFYIGGIFGFRFGRIEPELEISYIEAGDKGQIKIRQTFDGRPTKYDSNYKIPMLIETVSAKLYITERFRLRAGGYVGQILSVKNESNLPGDNTKTELSNSWKKTDAGFMLGVNVGISKNLFLESSYIGGISDLRGYGNAVSNRMVRIGAGYYFF